MSKQEKRDPELAKSATWNPRNSFGLEYSMGSMPFEHLAAYELARLCPAGMEPLLFAQLQAWWPELAFSEANDSLLTGLADRPKGGRHDQPLG